MPEISRFFGIVIKMYWNDHTLPHFHAYYGGQKATFAIESVGLLAGALPKRQHLFVVEWALAHRPELLADWNLARAHRPLLSIEPLE
ncbi:MAG: DUF4160 domain-containing protein [Acidobacteriota bacterium]